MHDVRGGLTKLLSTAAQNGDLTQYSTKDLKVGRAFVRTLAHPTAQDQAILAGLEAALVGRPDEPDEPEPPKEDPVNTMTKAEAGQTTHKPQPKPSQKGKAPKRLVVLEDGIKKAFAKPKAEKAAKKAGPKKEDGKVIQYKTLADLPKESKPGFHRRTERVTKALKRLEAAKTAKDASRVARIQKRVDQLLATLKDRGELVLYEAHAKK